MVLQKNCLSKKALQNSRKKTSVREFRYNKLVVSWLYRKETSNKGFFPASILKFWWLLSTRKPLNNYFMNCFALLCKLPFLSHKNERASLKGTFRRVKRLRRTFEQFKPWMACNRVCTQPCTPYLV